MDRHFVLDNTLGAAFIGLFVAATLHGVSIVQTCYYFGHQEDPWTTKLLVAAVVLFDTIHQVLITHTVYLYTITYWGTPAILERIIWSMLVEVIFNGLTAFLVQSFLALRVWRCACLLRKSVLARNCSNQTFFSVSNKSKLLSGIIGLLILGEFGCVIAFTSMSLHLKTYAELAKLKYLSILVNALAAAGDVLIAATLCIILHYARTGFQRSDTMINKLIFFSVNTGVLTSLCAVASLISIVVDGGSFLYISFFFCIGRLYTNSLLATLNARKMIRKAGHGIHNTSDNLSMSLREFPKGGALSSRPRPTNISIKIDTTKQFITDSDRALDLEKAEISITTPSEMFTEKEIECISV